MKKFRSGAFTQREPRSKRAIACGSSRASFRIKRVPVIYHALRFGFDQTPRSRFRFSDADIQRVRAKKVFAFLRPTT